MKFTIRQLEIFKEVAKTGHVTNSCEALGISQSAVSMAIQELEGGLGTLLFERRNRRLILNENGRGFFSKAEKILSELYELESIFSESEVGGELKIGASMTIGDYMLPKIIYEFLKVYQKGKIELAVANTKDIAKMIQSGEIDIGFIEGMIENPEIETTSWMADELCIVVSDKAVYTKKEYDISELYEKRWIIREVGSGTREMFHRALGDQFSKLNIFLTLGHTESIKRVIIESDCISCISRLAVQKELNNNELFEIKLKKVDLRRSLKKAMHKDKFKSKILTEFIAFSGKYVK